MGTSAWSAAKSRWVRVLGRGDEGKEASLDRRLDESATALRSTGAADRERAEQDTEVEWRGTLRTLLEGAPDLVDAVRAEVDALPRAAGTEERVSVRQIAHVQGGASIQSGRDTSIS